MENENLLNDSKYRKFADNIDKALKQFEQTSDWTDLISALGKLGKVSILFINLERTSCFTSSKKFYFLC